MTEYKFIVFISALTTLCHMCISAQEKHRPGHLEPFGSGPSLELEEVSAFPDVHTFFSNYVMKSRPLKMSGVMKNSFPVKEWSDDYFLSLSVPEDNKVLVETKKKEDRSQNTKHMHFQDYVRTYNDTEQYMVQSVPDFLQSDFPLPYPLHCDQIYNELISEALMWYSSGGTKSVVHTDSVENMNCLVRGQKHFVMVDPQVYGDQVDIDRVEGAYSSMDVDSVDFDKFPGMEGVEFYHVHLSPGDCLFIPYKWIHQVRSFERNLAVNLWWNHYRSLDIDLSACTGSPDPDLTLDKVNIQGMDKPTIGEAKDFIETLLKKGPVNFQRLHDAVVGDLPMEEMDRQGGYKAPMQRIMKILDVNADGYIELEELDQVQDQEWEEMLGHMEWFNQILDALETKWEEVTGDYPEDDDYYYPEQDEDFDYEFDRDEL